MMNCTRVFKHRFYSDALSCSQKTCGPSSSFDVSDTLEVQLVCPRQALVHTGLLLRRDRIAQREDGIGLA